MSEDTKTEITKPEESKALSITLDKQKILCGVTVIIVLVGIYLFMQHTDMLKSTMVSKFLPNQVRGDLAGDKSWSLKKVFENFKERQARFLKTIGGK